jgi:hypothetical protein
VRVQGWRVRRSGTQPGHASAAVAAGRPRFGLLKRFSTDLASRVTMLPPPGAIFFAAGKLRGFRSVPKVGHPPYPFKDAL